MPSYWYYLVVRALLSVGESSFSVIAPTIIGDLFTAEQRSLAYGLFYVAIPFGTGLGFGVGGSPEDWRYLELVVESAGAWRYLEPGAAPELGSPED